MQNFDIIKSRFDTSSSYLKLKADNCLYKKNGVRKVKDGKKCQYYICINCNVTGKVLEGTHEFFYTKMNSIHTHEPPQDFVAYKEFIQDIKAVVSSSTRSAREIYDEKLFR